MHLRWGYRLWRDQDVEEMGLVNVKLYRRFCNIGRYDGASDVVRAEILARHGGIYVDADSECLRPLDDAPFLRSRFFVVEERTDQVPFLVNGAFMGAQAKHEVLLRYIAALSEVRKLLPSWVTVGPKLLTKVLAEGGPGIQVLPPWTFFTQTLNGEAVSGGEPYGRHFWSSTQDRSKGAFAGARSWAQA